MTTGKTIALTRWTFLDKELGTPKYSNKLYVSLEADTLGWLPTLSFTHLFNQEMSAAAAAAKSLQSCPTLCNPMDCRLPGSSIYGIFQARVLEWGAIVFSMTSLDSILKSRDITLPTKVYLIKAMVFPVVMNGCESWTIKKAEHWRIDAFVL